jgi:hypothetical protein
MSHQVCSIFLVFNQFHRTVNSPQLFVPLALIVLKGKFVQQKLKQILVLTIVTARLTDYTTNAKINVRPICTNILRELQWSSTNLGISTLGSSHASIQQPDHG